MPYPPRNTVVSPQVVSETETRSRSSSSARSSFRPARRSRREIEPATHGCAVWQCRWLCEVEIGNLIVFLDSRRLVFPSEPEVQRQARCDLEIVLEIESEVRLAVIPVKFGDVVGRG